MNKPRLTALVLLHFSALGCKAGESAPPESTTASATASTSATPTVTASAPAIASAAPSALASTTPTASATPTVTASTRPSATASAQPSANKLGKECRSTADCTPYYCALGFDGAEFSKTGTCVASPPIYKGRPLVALGEAHVAPAIGPELDDTNLVRLRADALEEHASVAAFGRTICELVALGAPGWLLGATASALADEVRHAEDTFALLERLGGGVTRPGPLPAAIAPFGPPAELAVGLYRDVFRGGAVGETLAAAAADAAASETKGEVHEHHRRIAADEARHAALALRTLVWLGENFPEVAAVRDEEIARFRSEATAEARMLVEPLFEVLGFAERS